ncbi:MAG: sugar ABC transporter ATP-binding protein [Planctomycetota bacterium]|jgi:simple sugar transport system ATP-binding protein|nr:sugar ABC transporter ATP-binding protein [Planctomycetota bacterium]
MNAIDARQIVKNFGGVRALKGVDFTVRQGEIMGLIGENGCGKSTLMKVISGVHRPDSGTLDIEGKQIAENNPFEAIKRGVSVIYQDLSLFPNLSALENVCLGPIIGDDSFLARQGLYREKAQTILKNLGVAINPRDLVEDLPIAKQQLVAIARALANDSRILILDEPTTALTRREIVQLFRLLGDLKARGLSFIFISHKLGEIMEICDRVTVMRDGLVVGVKNTEELTIGAIESMMLGHSLSFEKKRESYARGEPVLRVDHLSRKNNFQDVSFELRAGEVLGISGLLGSGRTELASALFGIAPADAGRVSVRGKETRIRHVADSIRRGIAYVPEDRLTQGLVMPHSIANNIVIATLDKYLNPLRLLDFGKIRATVGGWITRLAIKTDDGWKAANTLSGGNQQKIVLAKWLAMSPSVLILDGPTVGIDVGAKRGIYDTIQENARDGMAVIIISDEIPELLANCDRILIMRGGRIAAEISSADADEETLQALMETRGKVNA